MAIIRLLQTRNLVAICIVAATIIFIIFYSSWNSFEYDEAKEYTRCLVGSPCLYEDAVDFRIIVLTFNRPESLAKLLRSIEDVELDGDRASLEIWVDRDYKGRIHKPTLDFLKTYSWRGGPTRIHVQSAHAGIYGQWIDTWRPTADGREVALILEDDISVSKYIYRWLKAVHGRYDSRSDFAGATLTSDELKSHDGSSNALKAPKTETAFMYKCIGTWGFSPSATVWKDFQDWYHRTKITDPKFVPAVPGIEPTKWYENFVKEGREDTMWEQWFIYHAYKKKLFTVYNNLRAFNGDSSSCLCINRREVGLHSSSKGPEDYCTLLNRWDDSYAAMPKDIVKLDWNGTTIEKY